MELIYLTIFYIYGDNKKRISVVLLFEAIISFAVITFTVFNTDQRRFTFVGAFCIAFCILMYVAPLTVMSSKLSVGVRCSSGSPKNYESQFKEEVDFLSFVEVLEDDFHVESAISRSKGRRIASNGMGRRIASNGMGCRIRFVLQSD
ncbi:hypothetical protein QQ045_031815 [Rhodiola kirilowii]